MEERVNCFFMSTEFVISVKIKHSTNGSVSLCQLLFFWESHFANQLYFHTSDLPGQTRGQIGPSCTTGLSVNLNACIKKNEDFKEIKSRYLFRYIYLGKKKHKLLQRNIKNNDALARCYTCIHISYIVTTNPAFLECIV